MKCISCGYELKEGSRFCTECGIFQKQKKICPGCKIELPTDARFCINCGTPQPKFCLYCNAELSADAKFCMCCGTKVRELPIDGGSYLSRYASLYNLTEKPMELSSNKEGSSSSNYILFGDWPQSVKSDEVIINSMSYVSINGWECYKGSDGCFYVKKTALPLSKGAKFTNGQSILRGKDYYFKLEPIKWRVIDSNYCGGRLLLSEKALASGCFDIHGNFWSGVNINRKIKGETVFPNNYEFSTIRAFLNGIDGTAYDVENFTEKGFIDKAFSAAGRERIKSITVDNGNESIVGSGASIGEYWLDDDKNPYKYVCENTKDKVFLLSEKEITDSKYGFDTCSAGGSDSVRIRKATDYALVKGELSDNDTGEYEGEGLWWLRSPYYYTSAYARAVTSEGKADLHCIVCNVKGLIVPAIVL